jgi:hypothetical protein
MTRDTAPRGSQAPGLAFVLVLAGLIGNIVIAHLAHGDKARVFFGRQDWAGDFVKHVMSFPGPPIAPSMLPRLIDHFQTDIAINVGVLGHLHNMPETVLLTLLLRQTFAWADPILVYLLAASIFVSAWLYFVHRYAESEVRPWALGLALLNYPVLLMIERGNLFAGITAVCLLVALCRRRQDWTAAILVAVAVNIRPNAAVIALPLLAWNRETLVFIVRTAIVGIGLGVLCLAADSLAYPAYTLPSILRGLKLYSDGYVVGPFAMEFGSSLWGAVRHVVPWTGSAVALCTAAGLLPLIYSWFWRSRLSYAASCFIAIAACTLSTAILGDYHLAIFVMPLLVLKRHDPAYWPILLGCCWVLIPKNYTPDGVLSWQNYLNPAGLIVAVLLVVFTCCGRRAAMVPAHS